jgi:hypothetical protein
MMLPLVGGVPNIDPLQFAVAALPGYRDACAIAAEADEWLRTPPDLPTVDPALAEHISDEWIEAERARENAVADYEARRRIVQGRREVEANRALSIFTGGVDLILGVLQGDLTNILSRAAKVIPELAGATTPAQAIEADAGAAWKRLAELADDYSELRTAQEFVMLRGSVDLWRSCTPSMPGENHANQAYLKNIGDLWNNWRQPGINPRTLHLSDRATPDRDEPWPADSGPELMIWLVSSDAEPWIPTGKQLRELRDERNAPTEDDAPQESADNESRFDSLLYGPLLVERERQVKAAARQKKPGCDRIAVPVTTSKRQPAEIQGGTPQ